jgi:hypothetical protein
MLNYNPFNTPMQSNVRWSKEDCLNPNTLRDTINPYHYSQIVSNLMHAIVNSRLDCTYVVNSLTQYIFNKSKPITYSNFEKIIMRYQRNIYIGHHVLIITKW